jgi:copper homeostasis protein CutC
VASPDTNDHKPRVVFESCVESFDAALASAAGGVPRIALCARLDVGGTTPSAGL